MKRRNFLVRAILLFSQCQQTHEVPLQFCTHNPSCIYPFPNGKKLHSSKLKDFADDNFEFDENGGKFSLGNTVGKGEIARYDQFVLFPCFQKTFYCRRVKTWAFLFSMSRNVDRSFETNYLFLYRPNVP